MFVDAPHPAPVLDSADDDGETASMAGTRDDPRSWWRWDDDAVAGARGWPSLVRSVTGWDDVALPHLVATVTEAADEGRPFDGILGFSQGAAAAALLLAALPPERRPRFAVLAGAFLPAHEATAAAVRRAAPIDTPTLFIAGDGDALIPPPRSRELASFFSNATWLTHAGGHAVPTASGGVKDAYRAFFEAQR